MLFEVTQAIQLLGLDRVNHVKLERL